MPTPLAQAGRRGAPMPGAETPWHAGARLADRSVLGLDQAQAIVEVQNLVDRDDIRPHMNGDPKPDVEPPPHSDDELGGYAWPIHNEDEFQKASDQRQRRDRVLRIHEDAMHRTDLHALRTLMEWPAVRA